MFQVYPIFEQDNVEEAYRKLNAFLAELDALDVHVPLENVRANTKFYPDYRQTATMLEVAVEMSGIAAYQLAPKIMEAHRLVLSSTVQVPAPNAEEKPVTVPADDDFDPFLDSDEALP